MTSLDRSTPRSERGRLAPAVKITLIYAIFGALWILLSDRLVAAFRAEPDAITRLQTIKGWVYILVTAGLIYYLIRRLLRQIVKIELKLRENREQLRLILNSIGEGVIAADVRGRIIRMNPVAERLTGRSQAEARGRSLGEVLEVTPPEGASALADLVGQVLREGRVIKLASREAVLTARAGRRCGIAATGSPIRDRAGATVGMVLVLSDVTEQRRLEEQLRQAQKLEALGKLAGGVAHDFNNLLSGILGYAELLHNQLNADERTREAAEDARVILETAQRAAGLVAQLLLFTRQGKLMPVQIDLHELIEDVIRLLRHMLDSRIEIARQLTAAHSLVSGDPAQLQSAILNLALNARDAMPEGGRLSFATALVTVGADADASLRPGRYVELRVSDTGEGMDESVLARVFEPFFTTKEVGKGSGLGLAAVYGVMQAHGGTVEISSQPRRGTVCRLLLPLAEEEPAVAEPARAANRPGRGRILFVDDEPVIRNLAATILGNLGYEVLLAQDGEEALRLYEREHVDLVLLDLIMPRMDGREALRRLRALNPQVHVLILTGFRYFLDLPELRESPTLGFIDKPFHAEDLARKVAEVLQKS